MGRRKKARLSVWNALRNGKTAVLAVLVCVVAFAVFFGLRNHGFKSEAGVENRITRGVVNDLSDIQKKTQMMDSAIDDGEDYDRDTVGQTKDNPFLVLEIVPWLGHAEFGYMIQDCEPVDFKKIYHGTASNGFDNIETGKAVMSCFDDEYKGFDTSDGHQSGFEEKLKADGKADWLKSNNSISMSGYYEKVPEGHGNFVCVGDAENDSAKKDENKKIFGNDKENVYRPKFREAKSGEKGDFIWVTLNDGGWQWGGGTWLVHAKSENKCHENAGEEFNFAEGDREYTVRTEDTYWYMDNRNGDREQAMFVYYNDFLRTSLGVRTKEEIDNFNVVVKIIEPSELNEHPEWIKYADFIYCHKSTSYGTVNSLWTDSEGKDTRKVTKPSTTKKGVTFGKMDNGKQNDISWKAAIQLFMKMNGLGDYTEDTYAAGIFDVTIFQGTGDYEQKSCNYTLLDYETMQPANRKMNGTGYNNNIYKFCIMNFLMKQENFYDMFLTGDDPVVKIAADEGINNRQTGDAQTYWNVYGFLPDNTYYGETYGDWGWSRFKDKYGINTDGNSFLNPKGNQLVNGSSGTYNGNQFMTQFIGTNTVDKNNSDTKDAFDWFKEQDGKDRDKLSSSDIAYYLLHYKRDSGFDDGGRRKLQLNILEIEPSNNFEVFTEQRLKALFPKSKYKITMENIHIDKMTTAEFNSRKINLSEYNLVYFGIDASKFNTEKQNNFNAGNGKYVTIDNDTRYNDMSNNDNAGLQGKVYLHAGDVVTGKDGNYRTSGNDISAVKYRDVVRYARAGKYLMFADELYSYNADKNKRLNARILDRGSNIYKFIKNYAGNESYQNVFSIRKQLDSNFISTSALKQKVFIDKTPAGTTLNGNKLIFEFSLANLSDGEKYGVKLYVDLNGDGVFSDDSDSSELVNIWCTDKKTTFNEKGEYTVTYEIPDNRDVGAVSWKFVVYNKDNENDCKAVTGVSRYMGSKEDGVEQKKTKEVHVLQVINDGEGKSNLENALVQGTGLFSKYVNGLEDYTIKVDTVSLSEYLSEFKSAAAANKADNAFIFDGKTYHYPPDYAGYTVYLISCGANFGKNGNNENGAVSFISFMEKRGKSAVFTNDTIVAGNSSAGAKQLKDSAGLSRFTSTGSSTMGYNDSPDYSEGLSDTVKTYRRSDYESLEYTYMAAMYAGTKADNEYPAFKAKIWTQANGSDKMGYNSGNQKAKTLTRTNIGAVTSYPYKIGEFIDISGTSAQTFQLNMDNPMATVWYSLGGESDKSKYGESKEEKSEYDKTKNNTAYGISPNDGTNNYYLYNVENVFYDGIDLSDNIGDDEMKLFINTLIGAYEAAYKEPSVIVDKAAALKKNAEDPTITLESYDIVNAIREFKMEVSTDSNKVVKDVKYKEYLKNAQVLAESKTTVNATPTPIPDISDDSETGTDGPDMPEEEGHPNGIDVTNKNYIAKTDTHKIYFTPYDGNLIGGKIVEFSAGFAASRSDDGTAMPIKEIYREYLDKNGNKHVRKLISDDGVYKDSTEDYLTDSVQYFILFNESYVNQWEYIRFGIKNKKLEATSYLHIENLEVPQTSADEVYIFDID